jgi:hypothetical protein
MEQFCVHGQVPSVGNKHIYVGSVFKHSLQNPVSSAVQTRSSDKGDKREHGNHIKPALFSV